MSKKISAQVHSKAKGNKTLRHKSSYMRSIDRRERLRKQARPLKREPRNRCEHCKHPIAKPTNGLCHRCYKFSVKLIRANKNIKTFKL